MYPFTLTLVVASVASVLALPSSIPAELGKRDWTSDAKGNIKLIFSDDTVKLGTLPTDVIVQQLATLCSESGQCDTGSVDITGYYLVQGQNQIAETVTINPSGIYPTWIHRGLFEALAAAVNAVAKCEKTTVTKDDCEPSSRGCGGEFGAEQSFTVTQCTVPRFWGINYQAADADQNENYAPPSVSNDITVAYDTDGFCSTFSTVGSAVAGAVSGAAGGVFSLLGLFCQH